MCRPRAVGGPLSGTGPARHRCPQTCRGACETGPGSSCRGDPLVVWESQPVSAHRGPRQPRRRPNASDATNTHQQRDASRPRIRATCRTVRMRSELVRTPSGRPQRASGAAAVEALDGPRHATFLHQPSLSLKIREASKRPRAARASKTPTQRPALRRKQKSAQPSQAGRFRIRTATRKASQPRRLTSRPELAAAVPRRTCSRSWRPCAGFPGIPAA